eukprot:gb/GECH01004713.1/.p1 GENE.gb/GECH01004713.1/~~gb/GECH01004713.1/.p1  ORF type:complete len:289 (+),score=80.01 gb/GECH01004713.1/:1-867(+)
MSSTRLERGQAIRDDPLLMSILASSTVSCLNLQQERPPSNVLTLPKNRKRKHAHINTTLEREEYDTHTPVTPNESNYSSEKESTETQDLEAIVEEAQNPKNDRVLNQINNDANTSLGLSAINIIHREELDSLDLLCDQCIEEIKSQLKLNEQKESDKKPEENRKNKKPRRRSSEKKKEHDKKEYKRLPPEATEVLNMWFFNHLHDPYPTDSEKKELAERCGLKISQINNWFGNKRMRYKRKMIDGSNSRMEIPTEPSSGAFFGANSSNLSSDSPSSENFYVHGDGSFE